MTNPFPDPATDPEGAYRRAEARFKAKDYTGAAALFIALADEQPDLHDLQLFTARSFYHSAQLGKAEERLRLIVEKWPDDAYAHFMLARTLQRAGRADEGRKHLLLAEAMGYTDE